MFSIFSSQNQFAVAVHSGKFLKVIIGIFLVYFSKICTWQW